MSSCSPLAFILISYCHKGRQSNALGPRSLWGPIDANKCGSYSVNGRRGGGGGRTLSAVYCRSARLFLPLYLHSVNQIFDRQRRQSEIHSNFQSLVGQFHFLDFIDTYSHRAPHHICWTTTFDGLVFYAIKIWWIVYFLCLDLISCISTNLAVF